MQEADYLALVQQRESCRDYNPDKPVEKEKILACLEAARLAPSACNSQPWHYTVVTNAEQCKALRPMLQGVVPNKFVNDCPAFIIVSETPAGAAATIGGRMQKQHYALTDIGLSVSQLCLTATTLGLSSCILGYFHEKEIKEQFKLPAVYRVRLVISLGYAKKEGLRKKIRKELSEISAFWD